MKSTLIFWYPKDEMSWLHCAMVRKGMMVIEKAMRGRFILNMQVTKLT
jgi:hypothetical protein